MDVRIFRDQADYALRICLKSGIVNHTHYCDCVIRRIAETVSRSLSEESYVHPGLQILRGHDAKNGTTYTETLRTYILSMCDSMKTIQTLYIHRNTLKYRLRIIEQITGLDLHDRDTLTVLFLNFNILDQGDSFRNAGAENATPILEAERSSV
jgi:sugar diacid utilization regulator